MSRLRSRTGCRDGGAEPVPERLGEIRQPFRKFIVVRQAAARTHGQEVSLGARIARFGTCGALLELARFPFETISESASHAGGSPWEVLDVAIFGRTSIFGAAGCTLGVASNSRSAESQCSSARPSPRPVAFQIS